MQSANAEQVSQTEIFRVSTVNVGLGDALRHREPIRWLFFTLKSERRDWYAEVSFQG